jgi:hypothetical protein
MAEPETQSVESLGVNRLSNHKLAVLISLVIGVSLILVSVALGIYNSSGAAQLDLSRPGFSSIQKDVKDERNINSYPSNGTFDKKAFDDFKALFSQRTQAVQGINGFDPSAVANDAFRLTPVTN